MKVAPFNRYQTLDVVRALAASGRAGEVALYTGNDDAIVLDLLADFPAAPETRPVRFVGGLLGQWGVWTRRAVELLEAVKRVPARGRGGRSRPPGPRPAAHRRERRPLRRPERLPRLHPRHPRGAPPPGAPRRAVVPRPARGPLARAGRGDRPRPGGVPAPRRRRVRPGEPRPVAELSALADVVRAQKQGVARGITSVCSAHPVVLQAAMEQALEDGSGVLVESTSNQVNQEGGYTGVTPGGVRGLRRRGLATEAGLSGDRVILGGDHLGPHPWRAQGATIAMAARGGDGPPVRAGRLREGPPRREHAPARTTRSAPSPTPWRRRGRRTSPRRRRRPPPSVPRARPAPVYVVGTEVPPPGGQTGRARGSGGHAGRGCRRERSLSPAKRSDDADSSGRGSG